MSLPLTRRIARAALLIAAGAAPVVGAAGSASALDHSLAPTGALGSLTALDVADAGDTVGSASRTTEDVVGEAAPAAGKSVDTVGKTATPVAQKVAGQTADSAGGALGGLPAGQALGGLPLG